MFLDFWRTSFIGILEPEFNVFRVNIRGEGFFSQPYLFSNVFILWVPFWLFPDCWQEIDLCVKEAVIYTPRATFSGNKTYLENIKLVPSFFGIWAENFLNFWQQKLSRVVQIAFYVLREKIPFLFFLYSPSKMSQVFHRKKAELSKLHPMSPE